MRRASFAAALGLVVMGLSGCGTAANLSGGAQGFRPMQIYGGVLRDVNSGEKFVSTNWTGFTDWQQDIGVVVGVGLIGLDLPLSAIGDTLTLPITIPAVLLRPPDPATNVSRKNVAAPPPTTNGPVPPAAAPPPAADVASK